jgi:hypothetical protein
MQAHGGGAQTKQIRRHERRNNMLEFLFPDNANQRWHRWQRATS